MILNNKRKISVFLLLGCIVLCSVLYGCKVFARTEATLQESLVDKAVMQGVYKCYNGGFIKPEISPLSDYTGISTLFTDRDSGENYVVLPTGTGPSGVLGMGWRYAINDDGLSCQQFFGGGTYGMGFRGSNDNILSATGHEAPNRSDSQKVEDFISNMGYAIEVIEDDTCFSLTYSGGSSDRRDNITRADNKSTNSVCKDSDGQLYIDRSYREDISNRIGFGNQAVNDDNKYMGNGNNSGGHILLKNNIVCLNFNDGGGWRNKGCLDFDSNSSGELNTNWLMKLVSAACGSYICKWKDLDTWTEYSYTFDARRDAGSSNNSLSKSSAHFKGNSSTLAAYDAINYLFNKDVAAASTWYDVNHSESLSDPLSVDGLEKRVLYQDYLVTYYKVMVDCREDLMEEAFDGTVKWVDFSTTPAVAKECHYSTGDAKNKDKPVNGIDDNGFYAYHSIANLDALLAEIDKLGLDYTDEEIADMTEINNGEIEGGGDDELSACYDDSGVLGWILCPVIEAVADIGKNNVG